MVARHFPILLTLWCCCFLLDKLTADNQSTTVDLSSHTYDICHVNGQCPNYVCTCRNQSSTDLSLYCWVNVSMSGVIVSHMQIHQDSYFFEKCREQSPLFLQFLKNWLSKNLSSLVLVECKHNCQNPIRMITVSESFGNQIDSGLFDNFTEIAANSSLVYETLQYTNKNLSQPLKEFISQAEETTNLILDENGLETLNRSIFNQHLKSLSISHNALSELPKDTFWNLKNLNFLNLTNNNIAIIPVETFANNSNLKILDLSQNNIVYFRDAIFKNLTNLIFLSLRGNRLVSFPEFLLRELKSLEYVDLSHNQAVSFSSYLFQNSENLLHLNLSYNKLIKIEYKTFQNSTKLLTLDLSHNLLNYLSPKLFDKLSNLTNLNLSSNRFSDLEENLLQSLTNLLFVDLSANELNSIPSGLFAANHKLQFIALNSNRLHQLAPNTFTSNSLLETLNLNHNLLISVDDNLLNGLTKLRLLFLKSNRLASISGNLFKDQKEIEEIDLSRNSITVIGKNVFVSNEKLNRIDLSFNDLITIPSIQPNSSSKNLSLVLDNNKISIITLPFQSNLNSLKKLSLDNNCISIIAHDILANKSAFEYNLIEEVSMVNCCLPAFSSLLPVNVGKFLDVRFNHIVRMDLSGFASWKSRKKVDLRGNRIESVELETTVDQETECSDTEILLDGNTFLCDCRLRPLQKQLKLKNPCLHFIPQNLLCHLPTSIANRSLSDLQEEELQCNDESHKDQTIPEKQCSVTAEKQQLIMNCSYRGFNEFPSNIPEVGSVILHLEHNHIQKLPPSDSPVWPRISELYLDNNLLSSADGLAVRSLRKVSLKRNKLELMDHNLEVLIETHPNVTFWMNENPWHCGCEIYHVRIILLQSLPKEHHDSFQCWIGDKLWSLGELLEGSVCPEHVQDNSVIYPYVLAGVIPLVIICLLLVCYFKSDLKSLFSSKSPEEQNIRIHEIKKH